MTYWKDEVEDLLIKEKNMKVEMKEFLKRLDMKEVKIIRNE